MPLDFSQFRGTRDQLPTHPRHIFASLSGRAPGFGYLRDVQGQVLDAWYARRSQRDVSIKMNTGTGKTAVGLLALRSSLNEGVGPALYVAPDRFLVGQVAAQALRLGIQYTEDPDSSDYVSGDAIGIVTVHKLINGRSIFGGPGSSRLEPVEIGALVIDDAHACVRTVEDQATVSIPEAHGAYAQMLTLFEADLRKQSLARLTDLKNRAVGTVVRVPISAWVDRYSEAMRLLQEYENNDDDNAWRFSWPLIKEILPACQAIFSSETFEIQPMCPPTNMITSFEVARRRLYLTATLADDSVLVTHFGVSEAAAQDPVTPSSAADIGDRLILSPRELNARMSDERVRDVVEALAAKYNVVVLVPSYRRAHFWRDISALTVGAEEIEEAVESLKRGHVGLVVFVNKYDGVDLPDDACRVLVIDGVPEAVDNAERREAEVLGGSDVLAHRKLQRIEQGMGRGVRSAEDYCVVLLLGASLSSVLAKPQMRKRLSPATQAQLELSMSVAEAISLDGLTEVIEQCLNRDEDWLEVSRECLVAVTYSEGSTRSYSSFTRSAFVAASIGQYSAASDEMRKAVNSVDDEILKGWLQEQLATYLHLDNPAQAQQCLAGAVKLNRRVMRPLSGVSYRRVPSAIDQASTSSRFLAERFKSGTELRLGIEELVGRLVFDDQGAHDFEAAVEELGWLLGFESQRPEQDSGIGPDNLWGLGDSQFLIIECKSEATSEVRKRDAGQLAHSMNWFAEEYNQMFRAIPVLIHHTGECATNAILPPGSRILDRAHLDALHQALVQLTSSLTAHGRLGDEQTTSELLTYHGFIRQDFVQRYTKRAS